MAKQLNSEQRYVIYLDLQRKLTKKSIAQKIGVHPSTITREVRRNANRDNQYVFCVAQEKCQKRKHSTLPNHRKDDLLWCRINCVIGEEKRNNTVLPKRPISRIEQAFMSVLRKPMANALETGRWI